MSYENTLSEQSLQLAMSAANAGKEVRHINLALLNELVNELKGEKNNRELCTALSDSAIAQLRDVLHNVSNQTFNNAVPMIKNIMEKLNQVINPDIPTAYSQFDCVPVIFSNLWESQLVSEMVEFGKKNVPDTASFTGMVKSVDDEQYADLIALAETGLGQFDDDVRALMGQFDETAIRSLFVNLVLHGIMPNQNTNSLMIDTADGRLGVHAWLLVALWARRLHGMVPTQSDIPLTRYQQLCLIMEAQAHAAMAATATLRRAYAEAGRLVIQAENNKVYVLNDLYTTYLAEGGTVEAIMGVIVSRDSLGQNISLISDIKAGQANLESAWNRHIQASKISQGQQGNALARRQFALIMEETAKWHYGDDTGKVAPAVQGAYASARERIEEVMDKLPSDFIKDCHTHVFDAVSHIFYPGSDVSRLLNNLREVGDNKDSGLTAEEIRVIASIHFVGDWLADITKMGEHGYEGLQFSSNLFPTTHGDMGLEAINWADAAKIGAGLAILAIVGFGVYKLITTMKQKGEIAKKGVEAIETAIVSIEKKEDDIDELGKGISEVIKKVPAEVKSEVEASAGNTEVFEVIVEVPPSLDEQPQVVETTPVAVKGDVNDVNISSQEAVKTDVPVEPAVISPAVQSPSVNRGKVWEGTAQNVLDFLGNKEVLSAGVAGVLFKNRARGADSSVDGYASIKNDVARFVSSFEGGVIGLFTSNSMLADIDDVKKKYEKNPESAMGDISKLVKEFIDVISTEIEDNDHYFNALAEKTLSGKGSHDTVTMRYGDVEQALTRNEGELGSIDKYALTITGNIERLTRDYSDLIAGSISESVKVGDIRGSEGLDLTAKVGKNIDHAITHIELNQVARSLVKDGEKLKAVLDSSTGDKDSLKELTDGLRWCFDKVERDPRQVNRALEATKALKDANSKMLELIIANVALRMKAIYDAQKVYMRCLNAVMKHNEARKRGYEKLVKQG